MREFDEFERELIRKLVNSENTNLGDFIADNILVNRGVKIDREEKKISLIYYKLDERARNDLFDILSLLTYLEKEFLIFTHKNPTLFKGDFLSSRALDTLVNDLEQHTTVGGEIIEFNFPTTLYDLMINYINTFYHPVSELKQLVENDFETFEKRQLNEALNQTKHSKNAFYVALGALVFTVCYTIFCNATVQLAEKQYNSLIENVNKMNINYTQEAYFTEKTRVSDSIFRSNIQSNLDVLIKNTTKEIKKK